jgi:hypothetical protein
LRAPPGSPTPITDAGAFEVDASGAAGTVIKTLTIPLGPYTVTLLVGVHVET